MQRKAKILKDLSETFVGGDSVNSDGYVQNGGIVPEVFVISKSKRARRSVEGIRLSGSEFSIQMEKPIEGNSARSRAEFKLDQPAVCRKLVMLKN